MCDVPVLIFEKDEFARIANGNPFAHHPEKEERFFHVTFLDDYPDKDSFEEAVAKKSESEDIAVHGKVIYLYCPDGYGRTKLNNTFLEKKLKTTATTRNWKTVNKLLAMANKTL